MAKAGGILKDLETIILPELVAAVFNMTGEEAVVVLREGCTKDDGRLWDSLSYSHNTGKGRQARIGDKAFAGDGAPTPSVPNFMYLGTRVRYAWYVEKGSGAHDTGDDSKGFVERITAWAQRHGWSDEDIPKLIKSIRNKGTEAHPFFFEKEEVVRRILSECLSRALKELPSKVTRTAPVKIDLNITSSNK